MWSSLVLVRIVKTGVCLYEDRSRLSVFYEDRRNGEKGSSRPSVFVRIARGCLRADRPNGEKGSSKLGISFGTERLPFPTPSTLI